MAIQPLFTQANMIEYLEYLKYLWLKWKWRKTIGPSMCWYLDSKQPLTKEESRVNSFQWQIHDRHGRKLGNGMIKFLKTGDPMVLNVFNDEKFIGYIAWHGVPRFTPSLTNPSPSIEELKEILEAWREGMGK